jgi:hypothetical protein
VTNETGKITSGMDKKMMTEGLVVLEARKVAWETGKFW